MDYLKSPTAPLPHASPSLHSLYRLPPSSSIFPSLVTLSQVLLSRHRGTAAYVATACGSCHTVTLRLANATSENPNEVKVFPPGQRFEIVSLTGTVTADGAHLHMSISDAEGRTWGGHLVAATVFTTLELAVGVLPLAECEAGRTFDERTGFKELYVTRASPPSSWLDFGSAGRGVLGLLLGGMAAGLGLRVGWAVAGAALKGAAVGGKRAS